MQGAVGVHRVVILQRGISQIFSNQREQHFLKHQVPSRDNALTCALFWLPVAVQQIHLWVAETTATRALTAISHQGLLAEPSLGAGRVWFLVARGLGSSFLCWLPVLWSTEIGRCLSAPRGIVFATLPWSKAASAYGLSFSCFRARGFLLLLPSRENSFSRVLLFLTWQKGCNQALVGLRRLGGLCSHPWGDV